MVVSCQEHANLNRSLRFCHLFLTLFPFSFSFCFGVHRAQHVDTDVYLISFFYCVFFFFVLFGVQVTFAVQSNCRGVNIFAPKSKSTEERLKQLIGEEEALQAKKKKRKRKTEKT